MKRDGRVSASNWIRWCGFTKITSQTHYWWIRMDSQQIWIYFYYSVAALIFPTAGVFRVVFEEQWPWEISIPMGGCIRNLFESVSDGYRPLQTEIKQSKMITVLNSPQINVCCVTEPALNSFLYAPVLFTVLLWGWKKKQYCGFIHCDVISWRGMLISLSLICHNDGSYCFTTLSLYLSLKCDIYFTECFSAYGWPELTLQK